MSFLQTNTFWKAASITFVICGVFFVWELGLLASIVPTLARPEATSTEMLFAVALAVLLSFNVGLFQYRKTHDGCPVGAKRATKIAGGLGALALICPACILLPISIAGVGLSLAFLSPFIPLLKMVALFLLVVSAVMLIPKKSWTSCSVCLSIGW